MAYEDGPFIQVACFCDIVIEDKTGTLSLIRIVDQIIHTEHGNLLPEEMPPVLLPLKLVLILKSGMAKGRSTLTIIPEKPDGSTDNPHLVTCHFEGEERGQCAIINMAYTFTLEGLYWFNILLENVKITAIPIRVKYNRVITSSTTT